MPALRFAGTTSERDANPTRGVAGRESGRAKPEPVESSREKRTRDGPSLAPTFHPRALRESSRTSHGTELRNSDVTGTVRREPGTPQLEARGRETRCENRRRVAAPINLRTEERSTARADRDPGRPVASAKAESRRKPERGAAGKPGATFSRNALERQNPMGASSGRTANPRAIVTDSGGEQGPEVGSANGGT
jgi:hypothetical protein